jgi:UDP-hydrolysing UDP-N-acetyl-D-glucosamine 2-epimerase
MPKPRKICVVTGTRAEYGLLYWLMKELDAAPDVELQIIACAMHLSPEFGLTYRQIEADGFTIDAKVEMLLSGDTPSAITKSIGLGCIGFADAFDRLAPDIIVMLGDRYEILAAAQAALVACIPVAHVHGGEGTEGAIDEAIRHSITKMSHLHFVGAAGYRDRVIQLGEDPARIYAFGAPGLENVTRLERLDRAALEDDLGFKFGARNMLITYHPETLGRETPDVPLAELFAALDQYPDAHLVFTKPNSDTSGRIINTMIDDYVAAKGTRAMAVTTLGSLRYLSAIALVDVVVGNSSSGIIEVPALDTPTVNIGNRQAGRLRAASIIDCTESRQDIAAGIERALSTEFMQSIKGQAQAYEGGNVASKITKVLGSIDLDDIIVKKFHTISVSDRADQDMPVRGIESLAQ